ncbi:MAG: ABC transporter permease [Gemmatimonadetes bacterium]|uniref:ABC transporter permease n=1 Tax=Candidatus Kutchimonas denitrificans TaxID=3056748 RepID=A0AAE4ZCZ4_9BACT|nr:ABC transporter permease [Gemmatimonadota bacterium]NIR76421.1 ABC transporter permease [Candidatus Kutchimonas denitrificans]NIS03240.1 ABC transporter permease [Gemmatimonadota bacterium]NIT69101.1 ABC transporter permease [Gemmatimonadota bacterium]NIU54493.1 ABC transporter permease [Gemmatimonadota bacterium]
MRNVWTIARRELRGYFDHPTAYILLVVFLAINAFFFFRSAFLVSEASLRPMFDLLPWITLFFVPAVTMGVLAEERRRGTLEVVLSHPVSEAELLLGKYVGNLLFLLMALASTILIPLTLLWGGSLDFGVVFAQYFGAFLLLAGMAAVGLFASALTRNQITAFILGTVIIFALMMVGTEVVQIGLPGWLAGPAASLGILRHFGNVARGVIDLRDLVYFAALALAFLALAYWQLLRGRLNTRGRLYRNLRIGTVTVVGIAVFAGLFGSYIPGRLDLTAENLYTLSDGTKDILRGLDDLVTLTLYASDELPAQVEPLARDVNDVLRDFDRYGGGNIQIVRKDPDASEAALQEAQQRGIRSVQFNVVRREELQLKQGWLGIAVSYAGESESIPFVGDTRNLEYQLASRVWRLTRTDTPTVAFTSGHGEKTQADYTGFTRELGQTYRLETVDLTDAEAELGSEIDAVIVAGPTQPLGARPRALLRRYLGNDGRLLYLGEGSNINMRFLLAMQVPDSARDFTRQFGVELGANMAFDLRSNESIQVPGEVFNYIVAYPFWLRALPATDHAITRNLNSVFLPWASALDTLATMSGREFTPLLETSEFAGTQTGQFEIRPEQDIPYDPATLEPQLLALAIDGAIGSDAANTPIPEPPAEPDSLAESDSLMVPEATADDDGQDSAAPTAVDRTAVAGEPTGRVVMVGDSEFLTDQFSRSAPENRLFALNAVDWLTQTEALLDIRSKTATPRPLVFESNLQMQLVKYINLVGVPLLFVLLGAVRLIRRRALTRRTYGA